MVNKAVEPFYQQIKTSDLHSIPLWHYCASAKKDIKQVIVLVHGVAEHSGRYSELAQYLAHQQRAVIVFDQRGHGQTIKDRHAGRINFESGWWHWQNDLDAVMNWCKDEYPHIPTVLYGHGLGAFIVQHYMTDHSDKITAAVLTGSNRISRNTATLAKIMCASVMKINANAPSNTLNELIFLGANARTSQTTKYDWISSDTQSVQDYEQDPLCGFIAPAGLWYQVFQGIESLRPKRCSDKNIPIAFFSGKDDPMGHYGKGVSKLYDYYDHCGFTHLHQKLYQDQRHALHNEQSPVEFKADLIMWLENLLT